MGEETTPRRKPEPIEKAILLVVEGADAKFFCIWAWKAYRPRDECQVLDFGGIAELGAYLKSLRLATGFEQKAKVVVILRDAEESGARAVASVQGSLRKACFAVPDAPFRVQDGHPRTALVLFPGPDKNGTLEDLCLSTVVGKPVLDCADSFLECCEACGSQIRRPSKMRLHAYLSGHDKYAGLKLGEAASANAWDWDHENMRPLRDLLRSL